MSDAVVAGIAPAVREGNWIDLFVGDPDTAPPPEAVAAWAEAMPHIVEFAAAVTHDGALGGCDDDGEFAFALDLLLEGLENRRLSAT